jgi:hypothetical protein
MAKAIVKQYGRNKQGQVVKTKQTVVKGRGANADTVLAAAGMNKSMTENQLKALQAQHQHTEKMADIARKGANFQSAATQAGLAAQNAFRTFAPTHQGVTGAAKTATSSVEDLINGGAQTAGNSRDEDDDQGGFIG